MMSSLTFQANRILLFIPIILIGIISSPVFASNTYCVDSAVATGGTGACWSSPFKEFYSALNIAVAGDQIWVAKGTYKPSGSARSCSFLVNVNNVGIYGGYPSGGGTRDPVSNPTILSGDIGVASDISDNCYHVITIGSNVKTNSYIDGFTITAGNANSGSFPDYLGGGLVNSSSGVFTLNNVIFTNNYALRGGGMYNQGSAPTLTNVTFNSNYSTDTASGKAGGLYNYSNSNPILNNVSFIANSSALDGGGMYNYTSSPVLTNVIFQSNLATGSGAGMYNASSSVTSLSGVTFSGNTAHNHAGAIFNNASNSTIVNSTFSSNTASTGNGGAIYNSGGTQSLSSSTFTGNTAVAGGAIYNASISSLSMSNTLIWGNSAGVPMINSSSTPIISYSLIQNSNGSGSSWTSSLGIDAGHNVDSDPLLSSLGSYGGFTQTHALLPNSAAIDAAGTCGSTDQRGSSRVNACDIGAFESQGFTLSKVSGDPQSTSINTSFASPLIVGVSSASGEPVVGGTVTFTDLGTTAKTTLSSAQKVSLSSTNASLTAPTANTVMGSYNVQATINGASTPVNFSLTNTAAPTAPTAPSVLVATAISTSQINLVWVDNSSNETGFKIESPTGSALTTTAANATTYSHTGLTCGTTYSYSLKATNTAGDSSAVTATATTSACPITLPAAPSALVATAISTSQITLMWTDNSTNETAFKLESPIGSSLVNLAANTTSYSHTGLSCGTTYTYSVKASNVSGDSGVIVATATTLACPIIVPNAPTTLVATAVSASQINLTWTDNSTDETAFKLESPIGITLVNLAANTVSYNHTGLTCGTNYVYSLVASNAAGTSNAVFATATTPACPTIVPSAPSGLSATAVSASQINLTWTDNSNNETSFTLESPIGTSLVNLAPNTTSYSHTGLTCGTTYLYSLVASNAVGNSGAFFATATTAACPVITPVVIPITPSGLNATAVSASQINLTWTDNSNNETSFTLESPIGTSLVSLAPNTTSYNHTGLTCGTTYLYSLVASNAVGNSGTLFTSATTAACPTSVPNAPSGLSATAVSSSQINLTWTDNSTDETTFKLESPVGTALVNLAPNSTRYSHTGLSCGTSYTYSLKSSNTVGDSNTVTVTASTATCPTTAPNAPTILVATAVSASQINLSWTDNSTDETAFKLESPVGTALVNLAADTISYSHAGLSCGTTYTYSIKASNAAGDSAPQVTTASTAACPTASHYNLTLTVAGSGSGVISGTSAGSYPSGTAINLSAVTNSGSGFVSWSPSLCGSPFNLTANLNCTAIFNSLPAATYSLTLNKIGTGSGSLSGTTAGNYVANTAVNLVAVADTGSTFAGWSPTACAGFNLTQNTTCTAVFNRLASTPTHVLSITPTGDGNGIVGGTPSGTYAENTAVNLLAVAGDSSEFTGWTPSSCASSFLLSVDTICVASFHKKAGSSFNLTVDITGSGTGVILGTAAGVYAVNTMINVVAIADNDATFTAWTPSSCGNSFALTADTHCNANFSKKAATQYHLNVTQSGQGSGTITGTATGDYVSGTVINLTATAADGSVFAGWSPINCGNFFALSADMNCTAVFNKVLTTLDGKPAYNLTLLSSGVSNAILTATPAAPYAAGTLVKLLAYAPNAQFLGWQGNGCDNSVTLNSNLICIANFQALSAGDVRFVDDIGNALSQRTVKKSAKTLKVNVARVAGSDGVITVRYQTQAGTALDGTDYQAVNGTLTWGNLDSAGKIIEIPILNNSVGDKYFYLLLNTDNASVKLDSSFVKLTVQDDLAQPNCDNALQFDAQGKLQGNMGCFNNTVNSINVTDTVQVFASNPLSVRSTLALNPAHVGQYGEVLIVAVYFPLDSPDAPIAFYRRGTTWLHWSGVLDDLSAVTRYASLPAQLDIDIYDGVLSNALGYFKIYVGYRLADGGIVFNGLNVLKINVIANPQ